MSDAGVADNWADLDIKEEEKEILDLMIERKRAQIRKFQSVAAARKSSPLKAAEAEAKELDHNREDVGPKEKSREGIDQLLQFGVQECFIDPKEAEHILASAVLSASLQQEAEEAAADGKFPLAEREPADELRWFINSRKELHDAIQFMLDNPEHEVYPGTKGPYLNIVEQNSDKLDLRTLVQELLSKNHDIKFGRKDIMQDDKTYKDRIAKSLQAGLINNYFT